MWRLLIFYPGAAVFAAVVNFVCFGKLYGDGKEKPGRSHRIALVWET